MRSGTLGFSGPSITVRLYSITGFTLMGAKNPIKSITWRSFVMFCMKSPARLTRGQPDPPDIAPNAPNDQRAPPNRPGQFAPPPYLPPYLRQPAPIFPGAGGKPKQPTTGADIGAKLTRPNQSTGPTKRPANGANDQTRANPRKTQTTPQTGPIVKCALTYLAKPKKPRIDPGSFWFYVNSQ